MKQTAAMVLLLCVVAVGAYAVDVHQSPAKVIAPSITTTPGSKQNTGDNAAPAGVTEVKPKAVSPESVKYLQRMREKTPFGTRGLDLTALRAGWARDASRRSKT